MSNAILEVIACSVTDAIEAQKGGASRLEIVRELERDLVRALVIDNGYD